MARDELSFYQQFRQQYAEELDLWRAHSEEFWKSHHAWNPLNWVDYTFELFNNLQVAPLIAIVKAYALNIAGGYSAHGQFVQPASDMAEALHTSSTHVAKGDALFRAGLNAIIDGAVETANYDATTVVSGLALYLTRWIWNWYRRATTVQKLRWLLNLLKMPSTEEKLFALLEKKFLSTKSLLNAGILILFIVWKVCVLANALISIHILAKTFRTSKFQSAWLSQKNALVKDKSLGRRRQRPIKNRVISSTLLPGSYRPS